MAPSRPILMTLNCQVGTRTFQIQTRTAKMANSVALTHFLLDSSKYYKPIIPPTGPNMRHKRGYRHYETDFNAFITTWTGHQSAQGKHTLTRIFTLVSIINSPVSLDLHVFAMWEEIAAAKRNTVHTGRTPQKGNNTIRFMWKICSCFKNHFPELHKPVPLSRNTLPP